MSKFAIVEAGAKLFKIVAETVQSIEEVHPLFAGDVKKELALSIIENLFNGLKSPIPFAELKDSAADNINTLVSVYKAQGLFQSKPVAA